MYGHHGFMQFFCEEDHSGRFPYHPIPHGLGERYCRVGNDAEDGL